VVRTIDDAHPHAGLEHSGRDDREIGARPPPLREAPHPAALPHVAREGPTGNPRPRRLQHDRSVDVTDDPALPDDRPVPVQPGGREVLAEDSVAQLPAQLAGPPVQLLARHGIHRLEVAAVVALVADDVIAQPDLLGARRADLDPVGRVLVDGGARRRGGVRTRRELPDVDTEDADPRSKGYAVTHLAQVASPS
jgi:hypothetical protein